MLSPQHRILCQESEALPLGLCTLGNKFFAICHYWVQFAIYFISEGKCVVISRKLQVILLKTCRLVTLHLVHALKMGQCEVIYVMITV